MKKKIRWLAISACNKTDVMLKTGEGCRVLAKKEFREFIESSSQLLMLDRFLKTTALSVTDIDALVVVYGPGSFSSVRIGCAIANSLAFALGIPVIGINLNQWDTFEKHLNFKTSHHRRLIPVIPRYSKPPNINL